MRRADLAAPGLRTLDSSLQALVLSHFEFEGFRTVMPAQAGIQGEQAAASGYSAWIPAFAGMTQHSSPPQNHRDRLLASSAGGFTLLEVMVALAILAIGIVTALELFAGSLRLGTKASRYTQAVIYAQNVMDQLFVKNTLDDEEAGGEMPGGYVWRARVQEIHPDENHTRLQPERQSPTDLVHLKEIEVRVSWEEGRGQQTLVLHSLRTLTEQPNQ